MIARLAHNHPRAVAWLYLLFVVGAVLAMAGLYRNLKDQADRNRSSLRALCALRQDLDLRIDSAEQYLASHPDGFAGISRAVIVSNLRNQLRTRRALNILDCKE